MPNHRHHHRAGSLKQSNKRNKRSKASKRSLAKASGGRVNVKTAATSSSAAVRSKADRRHQLQQRRNASRRAVLEKKRGIPVGQQRGPYAKGKPPRVIGIVSLAEPAASTTEEEEVEDKLLSLLVRKADVASKHEEQPSGGCGVTVKYNAYKKEGTITYLKAKSSSNTTRDAVMAALDLCRICDMILFVIDANASPTDNTDVHDAANCPLGMNIGDDDDDDDDTATTLSKQGTTHSSNSKRHPQDHDHLISHRGDCILAAVKGQGLPTPLTILARTTSPERELDDQDNSRTMQSVSAKSIRRSAMKKHADLKRYVSRFATTEFGAQHNKVMEVDLTMVEGDDGFRDGDDKEATMMMDEDNANVVNTIKSAAREDRSRQVASDALVRTLCTMAASPPKWVADAPRSYVIADSHRHDDHTQELILTGHVRGKVPFNVNSLVHVPNVGTFACKSVQRATPPLARARTGAMEQDEQVLFSDPTKRENLDIFAIPHALDGEQNLVGFDEDDYEDYNDDFDEDAAERPAGWSDYQSAWLDAVDDMDSGANDLDHGELAEELNRKPSSKRADASVATAMDWDDGIEVSAKEKHVLLEQRRKDQKEELDFPDEVEIDEETNARDRFARYRSLKSFRKTYWDPKENLPDSYGSIYHFSNFKATQRDVVADMKEVAAVANASGDFWGSDSVQKDTDESMNEDSEEPDDLLDGCIPSGSYVAITLENVTSLRISPGTTLVAVSLLPHENKISVLHMGLCQTAKCDQPETPVKSKDVLTFRCGWRTWRGRPVFSQNNLNSDKHKFERFLPQEGAFFAASVFGPVTYSPCPVLVFREDDPSSEGLGDQSSSQDLVAIGSIYGADADRIVVKRIILTGYPTRVHKRHATVKYMFYNPDDVRWFKPAGLSTKHGLHGHIVQSVGEHGTMKCLFNAPIKQHDTVMLPLYKRIFPKFPPATSSKGDKKTD